MKKLNAFLVSVLATAALNAAVIEQVIVRQQWPWSTDVKIEYKISAVTNPVDIAIQAYNGTTELSLPEAAITGDRYGIAEDGVGTLVIDPVKAFGTGKVALANFKVKLTVSDSAENINEVIYRIYDLKKFTCENVTRVDILNGKYGEYETDFGKIGAGYNTTLKDVLIWTGVTNYPGSKTTKLVMRKVSAAGVDWIMGRNPGDTTSNNNETPHPVRLTENYWIGVFELTMGQRKTLTGSYSQVAQTYTNAEFIAERPIHRGSYRYSHYAFLSSINGKFPGAGFTLPTEAQWEFACRAGSTTRFNSGLTTGAQLLGRDALNGGKNGNNYWGRNCTGEHGVAPVGWYRPNALGLYDMHGNAAEVCADAYLADYGVTDMSVTTVDPGKDRLLGNKTSGNAIYRGGDWEKNSDANIGIPSRFSASVTYDGDVNAAYYGCRLCIVDVN